MEGLGVTFVLLSHFEVRPLAVLIVGALIVGTFFGLRSALDRVRSIRLDDLERDFVAGLEVSCFEPHQVFIDDAWTTRSKPAQPKRYIYGTIVAMWTTG